MLARAGSGEARVVRAHAEIDLDEVRGSPRPSRCERGSGRRIAAIRLLTALSGERGERCCVRAQLRDLERNRGCVLELLFKLEVAARIALLFALCVMQRGERVLPDLAVGLSEHDCPLADCPGLRDNSSRVLPGVARAVRDHAGEARRKGDAERSRRSASGSAPVSREPLEKLTEPQVEVVVAIQSRTSLRRSAGAFIHFAPVPLYLTESDVSALVGPPDSVEVIEACLLRIAAGEVEIAPRRRLRLPEGALADMAAADLGLGLAGGKLYAATPESATFVVCLFDSETSALAAVIEADRLGCLRTGAASGVAAKYLARSGATSLGVIGCGHQAVTQVDCIRAALPSIDRVVAYCRTEERLAAFCERTGAEPGISHRDVGAQDVVVTITSSRDPVLRGEWLSPGALVIAAGANVASRRELDNAVLERATFVCCDWLEQARLESGDLIDPVATGVLDWLEVHELHEVVAGAIAGRQSDDDVVLFKSNGLAAWDVALGAEVLRRARELGVGRTL